MKTRIVLTALLVAAIALAPAMAQPKPALNDGEAHGDPPFLLEDGWRPLLNGRDLNGWHPDEGKESTWFTTGGVRFEPVREPNLLHGDAGPGGRIVNGPDGRTANLVTDAKFGDVELYVEFMMAKGSNSGVYLHGLYEVQVLDSWEPGKVLKTADCGAIYHRWIDDKPVGGSIPMVNASRRPGEWQSFHIWFRGPKFDAGGKKVENARFLRVLHNGVLVQTDVEVDGGTRAHMRIPEARTNPIMLQGDHGPVAYRNIYVRELRPIVSR